MRPQIESLEGRNLMSVSLTLGTLVIQADLPSSNKAFIYVNADSSVSVNLNGKVSTFNANSVQRVVYEGAQGGGDLFENDTNIIPSQVKLYGKGNTFLGSLEQDDVYLFGSGDFIDGGGGGDVIVTSGGNNTITPYPDQVVVPP
jgi:hypothetical protein